MDFRVSLPSLYLVTLLVPLGLAAQNVFVNVESYGAVADGNTDNYGAITQAISSLHAGETLYFPCTRGGAYNIGSPLDFGNLRNVAIKGAARTGCQLAYQSSGAHEFAFGFIGTASVVIENIDFNVTSRSQPPSTVLLLGRTGPSQYSGSLQFNNVQVEGYATRAIVYSVGSEQNTWLEPTILLRGGGAQYAYYTASVDELGLGNLPGSSNFVSNLSTWMQNFIITDYSGSGSGHVLIYDAGYDSAAGNHTYRDGYLATGSNGTAMVIYASPGSTAWMALTIDSIRFENGGLMFDFAGGGSYGDISITNTKAAGPVQYLIHLPTTCYDCTFESNSVIQGASTTSLFGTLRNSHVSENYPFTVGTAIDSFIEDRTSGIFQLGSGAGTAVGCSASNEGALQYLKGSNGADGTFRICQRRSGSYNWITH